jgi:phytoene synthase
MDHFRLVQDGFTEARAITKEYAKTFYFASRFLPRKQRDAACAIYALCRITDDTVDSQGHDAGLQRLESVQETIESIYNGAHLSERVLVAFKETVTTYEIHKRYFDELVEGMYMDLNKNRYCTFEELYTYCIKVAGVVGLIMLKIFGTRSPAAEPYALDLGVAMQLTNIVRDIKEDFLRGRVYLPSEEMERFGVTENHIAEGKLDEHFKALMRFQIERARGYYRNAAQGITMINSILPRYAVWVMSALYAGILRAIEDNGYDIFSRRAHVTTLGKVGTAVKVLLRGINL